jgi:hypothetical protein
MLAPELAVSRKVGLQLVRALALAGLAAACCLAGLGSSGDMRPLPAAVTAT